MVVYVNLQYMIDLYQNQCALLNSNEKFISSLVCIIKLDCEKKLEIEPCKSINEQKHSSYSF